MTTHNDRNHTAKSTHFGIDWKSEGLTKAEAEYAAERFCREWEEDGMQVTAAVFSADGTLISHHPTVKTLEQRNEELRAALRQVIAMLKQPVQFTKIPLSWHAHAPHALKDWNPIATIQILRGDCASAVRMAEAALTFDSRHDTEKL